jgi:hypothetical protein
MHKIHFHKGFKHIHKHLCHFASKVHQPVGLGLHKPSSHHQQLSLPSHHKAKHHKSRHSEPAVDDYSSRRKRLHPLKFKY